MNTLLHSAEAVSRISACSILTHISKTELAYMVGIGVFMLFFLYLNFRNEPKKSRCVALSFVIGLWGFFTLYLLWGESYQQLYQQREQHFTKDTLQPYIQQHPQSIPVLDYTCGTSQKTNSYTLTKTKDLYPMIISYKDRNGKTKTIRGNITVQRKGDSGLTVQTTYIGKSLTDSWGAGYYEPVLTVSTNTEFHCGKVSKSK